MKTWKCPHINPKQSTIHNINKAKNRFSYNHFRNAKNYLKQQAMFQEDKKMSKA
jgi:hypothetical protein